MRLFLFVCIVVSLAACNRTSSNSFKLEGFIEGAENSEMIMLYYEILRNNEWQQIADTAKITNGKFLFEGNIDELTAASLVFGDCDVAIDVRLYLEPTTMKLRINKNQPYAYELSGTKVEKENIELRKERESDENIYYEGLKRMDDLLKQMKLNYNIPVLDSLMNLLLYTQRHTVAHSGLKMNRTSLDFILKHHTYRIAPDILFIIARRDTIPVDSLRNIYDNLPKRSKTSLLGKFALREIKSLESEKDTVEEIVEDSLIGNPAPDFTRKDLSGKTIRLSDFKNKQFVFLNFWASWCAPCIVDIPKIKDLHDQYSGKGLVIISISLDKDRDSWLNAINKYQLEAWPQILSVEDNNNSAPNTDDISLLYHVGYIPHFVLIDKQGKIIMSGGHLDEEQLTVIDKIIKGQ